MKRSAPGFTLVELLVVISIMAIMAVIGITVFSGVQKTARDAKRKEDLLAIAIALEQYKAQNGYYPPISAMQGWCATICNTDNAAVKNALAPIFANGVPCDPTRSGSTGDYYYNHIYGVSDGFEVLASLEGQTQGTVDTWSSCHGILWSNVYNLKVVNQQ